MPRSRGIKKNKKKNIINLFSWNKSEYQKESIIFIALHNKTTFCWTYFTWNSHLFLSKRPIHMFIARGNIFVYSKTPFHQRLDSNFNFHWHIPYFIKSCSPFSRIPSRINWFAIQNKHGDFCMKKIFPFTTQPITKT